MRSWPAPGCRSPGPTCSGAQGREILDLVRLALAMRVRVDSCLRLIADIDVEIDTFGQLAGNRLRHDSGYAAVQTIPGMGLTLGAVSVAEIGDVRRFPRTDAADQLGRSDPSPPGVRHRRARWADHQAGVPALHRLDRGRSGCRCRRGSGSPNAAAATSSARLAHRDPSAGPGHGRSSSRSPAQPLPIYAGLGQHSRSTPLGSGARSLPAHPYTASHARAVCPCWWWPAGDRPG